MSLDYRDIDDLSSAVASSVVNVYYRYVYNQTMDKTWALLPFILMTLASPDLMVNDTILLTAKLA